MLKRLAACAAGVLCLAGCRGTIAIPLSPSGGPPPANYPAADLRAHVTLLYGEHTYVLGKLAVAAANGRKDEYASYATLLALNGDDLISVISKSAGEGQANQFGDALLVGDGLFVDYMVAATTQQKDMADTAVQNLNAKYVPQMAQALSSALNISSSTGTGLVTDEVSTSTKFIDDAAAATPTAFYSDLRNAYVKSTDMGGAVAEAIALKFPDKYPGDVKGAGARLRAQLDTLLDEHSYLVTMTTDAAVAGPAADFNAVTGALSANTDELAHVIGGPFGSDAGSHAKTAWSNQNAAFIGYASSAGQASGARSSLAQSAADLTSFLSGLHATVDVAEQIKASVQVIDDQRAKSYDKVAPEDRYAAMLVAATGDALLNS